ncbi:hypothetical protein, partial [Kitasatospora sp. NPDC097643]|uniref:hypothetical protein n=1 Tax=Kitasatospora sp. NPDC097643 TaxID=3157230 RepID=UPI00332515DC
MDVSAVAMVRRLAGGFDGCHDDEPSGPRIGRGPRIASDRPDLSGGPVPRVSSVSLNEVVIVVAAGAGVLPVDAGVVLVVGGTGKTGRRVAERLSA